MVRELCLCECAGVRCVGVSVSSVQAAAASTPGPAVSAEGKATAARAMQPAWQPGSSRRKQAFSRCIWIKKRSARGGSSVSISSDEVRRRCKDPCLLLCPFHLVVQLVLVVLVELHVVEDLRHAHGRLVRELLRRRCARSGTRRAARSAGGGRRAGPARGRCAAPACRPCFSGLKTE